MSEILMVGTFPTIAEGALDEFVALCEASVVSARQEPGTLQYDWFLSEDKTRCVVVERYADSAALLTHMGNIAGLAKLVELGGGLELDVLGDLEPEVHEKLVPMVRAIHTRIAAR